MKLLELYSLSTSLKIGKQHLLESFYPLKEGGYITIHASSGMKAKDYPFYNEILTILSPLLEKNGVTIYQIGLPNDIPLKGCVHLMGKTSIHQTNYILSRSKLHIGNDSVWQHRAGHVGVPVIDLFGPTSIENHSPYDHTPNSIFLESHRNGKIPSFQGHEDRPTIALIPPEQVINAALKLLGANFGINRQSLAIGQLYPQSILEFVPNFGVDPSFLKDTPLTARIDYLPTVTDANWQSLAHCASHRKVAIVSDKPVPLGLLFQFKTQIVNVAFELNNSFDVEYIKEVKKIGIKTNFYSYESDAEKLSNLRLRLFDYAVIERKTRRVRDDFLQEMASYQNKELDKEWKVGENIWYKSNKFILSEGKIYLSKFALKNNLPTQTFEFNTQTLIDDPLVWEELDFFYFFNQSIQ